MSVALWIGIGVVFLAILPSVVAKARKGGEDRKKSADNSGDGGEASHSGDSGDCGGDGGGD